MPAPLTADSQPRADRADRRPARTATALVAAYVALVLLHLALAWPLNCPVRGDEVVYLGNARTLATGAGTVPADGRHAYKIGYSLLLLPAMLVDSSPLGGFKGAQISNALLLSLVLPLAFLLAGRLDGTLSDRDRLLVALCVACYPAAILYGTTAMSAGGFVPMFFVVALAAGAALRHRSAPAWAGFGAATGFLYGIHERALGIVLVAAVAALAALCQRSRRRWQALAFFVGLVACDGLIRWLDVPGSHWRTGDTSLRVLKHAVADPRTLLATATGHLWYLGLATFGVLLLGGFVLLADRRRGERSGEERDPLVPVLWLSAASVVAISILFNVARWDVARFTHWIYGRQSESVLLPVLVTALLAIRSTAARRNMRVLVAAGLATAATIAILTLVLRALWTPDVGGPYSFGASSAPLYLALLGHGRLAALAALGVGFVLLCWLLVTRWSWGVVAVTVLFLVSTATTYVTSWTGRYDEIEGERELVHLVRALEAGPVAPRPVIHYPLERTTFNFHFYNTAYFLPEYRFRRLPAAPRPAAGELVLSSTLDPTALAPGARLLGLESLPQRPLGYVQSLAVLPGRLQDELAGRGWLFPREFPGPLPRAALRAELALEGPPPSTRLRPDEVVPMRILVTNTGSCPWPNRRGLGDAQWSVALLTRWYPVGGDVPVTTARCDLPRVVYPGETLHLVPGLHAGDDRRPTPPGDYRVTITLAQTQDEEVVVSAEATLELQVEIGPKR